MRITKLSTAVMESNFDWTIVKIETDENITGYSEAFVGPGLTCVIREFSTILIGEDTTSIERIARRMRSSTIYASPGVGLLTWRSTDSSTAAARGATDISPIPAWLVRSRSRAMPAMTPRKYQEKAVQPAIAEATQ